MEAVNTPRCLSAKYKEDFAYPTIKDRVPVILTKVIDTIHRMKSEVLSIHGEEGTTDLKDIVGLLSKLRNELQTDKPLVPINDKRSDNGIWNDFLNKERVASLEDPSWFVSAWLYTECYFYRRIMESIYSSKMLQFIDPFKEQKCNALIVSMSAVISLATFLQTCSKQVNDRESVHRYLMDFIQISLWGNKCDLSISAGVENAQKMNIENSLHSLIPFILCDETESVQKCLLQGAAANVHIVLDNAGFELFTDLVLMEFLLVTNLAGSVTLHGKAMPWFVSDVTIEDFQWTLEQMKVSANEVLKYYGNKWQGYLDSGVVTYKAKDFWTLPHDCTKMKVIDPDLYNELALANLVIFKGDLNYRKLAGDLKWEVDTPFKDVLRGFLPTSICALRTVKCDLVIGITKEKAMETEKEDKDWLFDARWAVIQTCCKIK